MTNTAEKFENWCEKPLVANTLGNGWCARIDGCDVFDDVNQYGLKTRRTFSIASGLKTKEEAKEQLKKWLSSALEELEQNQ